VQLCVVFSEVCLFGIGTLTPLRVVNCEWLCHLFPPMFFWLQVFMCVCVCVRAQAGCSVVCNWSLCDLSVDVCVLICSGFNLLSIIFNFLTFLFLRRQTMDKVHKQNSLNTNTPSSESYKKRDNLRVF
jgi:hypothetical protein